MKRTTDEVRNALVKLTTYDRAAYFYNRLNDPDWFDDLKKLKALVPPRPTSAEPSPPWPAAIYLKKMAAILPLEVAEVASSVRATTLTTRRELMEIALKLPVRMAQRVLRHVEEWDDAAFGGLLLAMLFASVIKP